MASSHSAEPLAGEDRAQAALDGAAVLVALGAADRLGAEQALGRPPDPPVPQGLHTTRLVPRRAAPERARAHPEQARRSRLRDPPSPPQIMTS